MRSRPCWTVGISLFTTACCSFVGVLRTRCKGEAGIDSSATAAFKTPDSRVRRRVNDAGAARSVEFQPFLFPMRSSTSSHRRAVISLRGHELRCNACQETCCCCVRVMSRAGMHFSMNKARATSRSSSDSGGVAAATTTIANARMFELLVAGAQFPYFRLTKSRLASKNVAFAFQLIGSPVTASNFSARLTALRSSSCRS
ncbi:unannotated protein [freshwater metagenome]|uniref:Unannotated protein n=1 Tax=freshwater metagenome TaxID=449393 RepID=A0A6J7LPM7_9ZZZZ